MSQAIQEILTVLDLGCSVQLDKRQAARLATYIRDLKKDRDSLPGRAADAFKAERDALALQLKASEENARQQRDMKAKAREQRDALVSKMVLMHESITQAAGLLPAGAIDIISNIKAAQDMNTAQALAEIRAEAILGFATYIDSTGELSGDDCTFIIDEANQYAEKIRQGGAK
jgi:hypothetical protein